jgi:DNA-binding PadR family transcriptional regulator
MRDRRWMRGPHGHGGWGAGGFGPGFGGPGRRMRRGDVRRAVLSALADGPANGYEVMQRLEERSGGLWRPSPGSVYPLLQLLEDEGLVRSEQAEGARTYTLTETGRAEQEAEAQHGGAPWEHGTERDEMLRTLKEALGGTAAATAQIARTASPEQLEKSAEILRRSRKELYQILAED